MKQKLVLVLGMMMATAAWAQTPPAQASQATDVTLAPSSTVAAVAPSQQIAAPAGVMRIYVDTLNGQDAAAVQGILTQALYESKAVVITENQSNASLILKGTVWRKPLPPTRSTSAAGIRRSRSSSAAPADGMSPTVPPNSDDTTLGLASLNLGGAPADLGQYLYRLNLRVVNPDGDLVWMSGQGQQALAYTGSDAAVTETLAPLLAMLKTLAATPDPGH